MNFDFMKDLDGIREVHPCCSNAEELVKTKPDLSMFAARKSAEMIAKLLYVFAHTEEAYDLSFSDILFDETVKRYVNNRNVMDAFHYIRKNGNKAVHTDENISPEISLEVLKKLHFVVGESAKKISHISSYPKFNADIRENKEAELKDFEINEVVKKAYADYVISQNKLSKLMADFENEVSPYHFIPNDIEIYEHLIFDKKPVNPETIIEIQNYYGALALKVIKAQKKSYMMGEDVPVECSMDCELVIKGENEYTANTLVGFAEGIFYHISESDGFEIKISYRGPSIAPYNDDNFETMFTDIFRKKIVDKEKYYYRQLSLFLGHDECFFYTFKDGKYVDTPITDSVLDVDGCFWTNHVDMEITFDTDKYGETLEKLKDVTRKHIPEEEVRYCEDEWNDNPEQFLLSIQWITQNLRCVQNYLDEMTEIIAPIKDECDISLDGLWTNVEFPLGLAEWQWNGDRFLVLGTVD